MSEPINLAVSYARAIIDSHPRVLISTAYMLKPLCDAYICGYHRAMDQIRSLQIDTVHMERELLQLRSQEREIQLQLAAIRCHLDSIKNRREYLEDQIILAKQGQLALDARLESEV